MTDFNSVISVVTLNNNGLNELVKRDFQIGLNFILSTEGPLLILRLR